MEAGAGVMWRGFACRRARGLTPTLTGLGERAHLLRPGLTIEDFVTDVANVIENEELNGGNSFERLVLSDIE